MLKKILALILASITFCLILSGCDIIRETFNSDSGSLPSETPAEMDQQTWMNAMQAKQVPALDGVEYGSIIDWEQNYLVYAVYPKVTGKDAITSEMQSYIQNKVDLFKGEVSQGKGQTVSGTKPELSITYKPYALKNALVSFKVTTNADSGVSRTDNYITTFVYNLGTQVRMSLDQVFNGNMDYLTRISDLVRNKLNANSVLQGSLDKELFDSGTAPKKENFQNFVVGDREVIFYFNQYQIAPAAAGSFEVSLSFEDLKDVLWPDIYDPEEAVAAAANAAEEAEVQNVLPDYLKSDVGDMKAFSLEGIDPLKDKVVALTFDDGPNPSTTGDILEALKEYDAHATFFMLGNRVEEFPKTVRKVYESGNEIGNHSYDHKDFKRLSDEEIEAEIDKTNQAIYETVGLRPIIVRPPYGNVTDDIANVIGRACVLWTVDPEDWKYKDADIDYNNVMDNVRDGDIVLMHDIYDASAAAAKRIIRELTDRGYKLVTVSQMIQIAEARGQDVGLIVRDLRAKSKN